MGRTYGRTDGRMDPQTEEQYARPALQAGHKNMTYYKTIANIQYSSVVKYTINILTINDIYKCSVYIRKNKTRLLMKINIALN